MIASPLVTMLVLNWNGRALLAKSLPRLLAQTYAPHRVVVVDNGSTDGSAALIRDEFPTVTLIENGDNLGFARGINAGLQALGPLPDDSLLLLLNNDVYVEPDWLANFVQAWQQTENVGVAGCKLLFPDGAIQHLGGRLDAETAMSHHVADDHDSLAQAVDVEYVTGAALLISAETIQSQSNAPDFLDPLFSPFYYEETDLCYRVRASGQRVVVFPQVVAIHDESSSVRQVTGLQAFAAQQNRIRFVLKHFSAEKFTHTFVPAEAARLRVGHKEAHYQVMRQILTDSILSAPAWLASWDRSADSAAILSGLLQLRDVAVAQQLRFASVAPPPLTAVDFVGHSPIFGRIRAAWHAVAGKWVTAQLRREQNQINQTLATAINEQQTAHGASAAEIDHLLRHLHQLETRLRKMEAADAD